MYAVQRNTAQKNAHTSIWEDASSQTYTGETLWWLGRRMVAAKKVSVLPTNTASRRLIRNAASEPANGDRYRKRNTLSAPLNPLFYSE